MGAGKEHQNSRRMKFRRNKRQSTQLQNVDDRTNSRVAATWRLLMLRVPPLAVSVALLLGTGFSSAQAKSALPAEDRWNPQHIDGLPAEIRSAIAPYARVCGGPLAAEHSFVRYFQSGTTKLIGLHFEHLRCSNREAVCTAAGCLHQVYISTGGRYRLLRSSYVPELDLTQIKIPASR
jgi:hypothetical protein